MTTDQYVDAVGNIVVDVNASLFTDIAGGYIYCSAHPFSGGPDGDIDQYGDPDNYTRTYDKLTDEEFDHRSGQFQIIKLPFDLPTPTCCPKIVVHPR